MIQLYNVAKSYSVLWSLSDVCCFVTVLFSQAFKAIPNHGQSSKGKALVASGYMSAAVSPHRFHHVTLPQKKWVMVRSWLFGLGATSNLAIQTEIRCTDGSSYASSHGAKCWWSANPKTSVYWRSSQVDCSFAGWPQWKEADEPQLQVRNAFVLGQVRLWCQWQGYIRRALFSRFLGDQVQSWQFGCTTQIHGEYASCCLCWKVLSRCHQIWSFCPTGGWAEN